VQYLWERMKESGYLYKGSYDGWYCVPDETYFTDTQVQKGDEEYGSVGQHLCPDCHRPLERVQEESYFFKLSRTSFSSSMTSTPTLSSLRSA